jgi:hypothetical protein
MIYKLEKYMKAPTHYLRYLENIFSNSPKFELVMETDFAWCQIVTWENNRHYEQYFNILDGILTMIMWEEVNTTCVH